MLPNLLTVACETEKPLLTSFLQEKKSLWKRIVWNEENQEHKILRVKQTDRLMTRNDWLTPEFSNELLEKKKIQALNCHCKRKTLLRYSWWRLYVWN